MCCQWKVFRKSSVWPLFPNIPLAIFETQNTLKLFRQTYVHIKYEFLLPTHFPLNFFSISHPAVSVDMAYRECISAYCNYSDLGHWDSLSQRNFSRLLKRRGRYDESNLPTVDSTHWSSWKKRKRHIFYIGGITWSAVAASIGRKVAISGPQICPRPIHIDLHVQLLVASMAETFLSTLLPCISYRIHNVFVHRCVNFRLACSSWWMSWQFSIYIMHSIQ